MDEILVADFMVFHDVIADRPYDLVTGDEAWEVDYFLHENPELKRFAYCWLTDFVGWLPMPEAARRPFIYMPLRQHFEQFFHVHHRLQAHRAGRRMDFGGAEPDGLAEAIASQIACKVDYRPVERDVAIRPGGSSHRRPRLSRIGHDQPTDQSHALVSRPLTEDKIETIPAIGIADQRDQASKCSQQQAGPSKTSSIRVPQSWPTCARSNADVQRQCEA
jgi:hypothetical protein